MDETNAFVRFVDGGGPLGLSPLSNACRKDGIRAAAAIARAGFTPPMGVGFKAATAAAAAALFRPAVVGQFWGSDDVDAKLGNCFGPAIDSCGNCCNNGGGGVLIVLFGGGFNVLTVLLVLLLLSSKEGKTLSNIIGKFAMGLFNRGLDGNFIEATAGDESCFWAWDVIDAIDDAESAVLLMPKRLMPVEAAPVVLVNPPVRAKVLAFKLSLVFSFITKVLLAKVHRRRALTAG